MRHFAGANGAIFYGDFLFGMSIESDCIWLHSSQGLLSQIGMEHHGLHRRRFRVRTLHTQYWGDNAGWVSPVF
jgi:hypothetical protein